MPLCGAQSQRPRRLVVERLGDVPVLDDPGKRSSGRQLQNALGSVVVRATGHHAPPLQDHERRLHEFNRTSARDRRLERCVRRRRLGQSAYKLHHRNSLGLARDCKDLQAAARSRARLCCALWHVERARAPRRALPHTQRARVPLRVRSYQRRLVHRLRRREQRHADRSLHVGRLGCHERLRGL
eukprot:Amastigsp_a841804_114.p2 type:complete len:184 gc:universal Amastigsp_a841804_114:570-1121(+)